MADERLARAVLELSTSSKEFFTALDEVQKRSDGISKSFEQTGKSAQKAGVMWTVELGQPAMKALGWVKDGLVSAATGIVELGQRGADVADVSSAFGDLSGKVGETAGTMLGAMREGLKGTISDMEMMKMANGALGSGFIKSADAARSLSVGAMGLADRMGGDAKAAFEALTSSMATGRTAQLEQMGLSKALASATEQYAKSIGKTTSTLSSADKEQGRVAITLAAVNSEFKDSGPLDFADMINQAKAGVENFRNDVGLAIATSPALMAGMRAAGAEIGKAFGGDQSSRVQTLTGIVNALALRVVGFAKTLVDSAAWVTDAWDGVTYVFNAVRADLAGVADFLVNAFLQIATAASQIPGIGEKFKGVSTSLREVSNWLATAEQSWAKQAAAAATSGNATDVVFDRMRKGLVAVEVAMRTASASQAETSQSVKQGGEVMDESARKAEEKSKKVVSAAARELEAVTKAQDDIREKTYAVQSEMEIAQTTGIARKLLEIEASRQKELAGLPPFRDAYAAEYTVLFSLVEAFYAKQKAAAIENATSTTAIAAEAGFKTRAELEATAVKALETYQRMLESGKFTAETLAAAHEVAEKAKRDATDKTKKFQLSSGEAVLQGSVGILGALGEKNKKAAIAGAIIATYAAIAKSLASAPMPAALVLAASAALAGWENVKKIRASEPGGYRMGTPGLDFADFGGVSLAALHDQEAVIPRGKGHLLAGEIAAAMPDNDAVTQRLDRVVAALDALPAKMKRAFRDAALGTA